MSAAAARRRKQQASKKKASQDSLNGSGSDEECDAVVVRLHNLLSESTKESGAEAEATAYEALQLAQSQVRKCVKANDGRRAFRIASGVILQLLKGGYVAMASQLATQMMDALMETHTLVSSDMVEKMVEIDASFCTALSKKSTVLENEEGDSEKSRLQRLQVQLLRRAVRWSDDLGPMRYGDLSLHGLLGDCAWDAGERADAVLHYALAENPEKIAELLMTLPTKEEEEAEEGASVPGAAERDALLTRAVLVMVAVENLRDANILLRSFIKRDTDRDPAQLAKSYMAKDATRLQTHVTFCSALLRICETEATPLYQWLIRSFAKELNHYPDLQPYTSKIGRVYFGIEPPPSMLSMMENMMTMMSTGGAMAGMNPGGF